MKKFSYALLVGVLMSMMPCFADDGGDGGDSYVFNFDGPSGYPLVDSVYNFGKDVSWTVLKFMFLPVEIVTQILAKSI